MYRIGQIGLTMYPKQTVWEIEDLDTSVLPDNRLGSVFSPYFIKSSGAFVTAGKRLTPPELTPSDNNDQNIEPDEVWFFHILRRDDDLKESINVTLEVTFRADGNASLWNGLVQPLTPLDIRVISSEK